MWLDLMKAVVAVACIIGTLHWFRGQLAAMEPPERLKAKRKFLVGMVAAAALIGAMTLVLLRLSPD
jgi:hypothetical protein